jgi:sugar-specific transcriptional regulator TrmB
MSNHSEATIVDRIQHTSAFRSGESFTASDIYAALNLPAANVISVLGSMLDRKQVVLVDDRKPNRYKKAALTEENVFDRVYKRRLANPVEDPDA